MLPIRYLLAGAMVVAGMVLSGDQFISSATRKEQIVSTFGAIACEMEGAAIGQVCYVNQVPFCVLRAISDLADGSSPASFEEFEQQTADLSASILRKLIEG